MPITKREAHYGSPKELINNLLNKVDWFMCLAYSYT